MIKGRAALQGSAGLSDVMVSLRFQNTNAVTTILTDANGDYAFNSVGEGGPYTLEAQKAGYSFAPPSYVYNNLNADQTANFNAAVVSHSISGLVTTSTGAPLGGVTVSLTGSASTSVTTGPSGQYSFLNLAPGGNYTVTPSLGAYTFNPPSVVINNLAKNEAVNFTGTNTAPPSLPSVEFEQAGYHVAEDEHYKLIRVTRTGDASHVSTVEYATQDLSATQQTDYTLMLGTLSFAPGETSKTLFFLVTEDSLVEGTETLSVVLSNPDGAVLGNQSLAQIAITDNDSSANAPNAIDEAANFIRQHYHDFLNREPEPAGYQGWQDILNNCPVSGKDLNGNYCDRVEISSAFYRSQEFHDRGYLIYRFYAASLGKVPKYQEFMRDMQKVSGFLSVQQQEEARVEFIQEFMTRAEFKQRYEQFADAGAYVDAILSTAGVSLPQREKLISELQAGRITRGQVLRAVIESAEVDAKFYTESFVVM
ncbi:MAG TPA: carboxypeptidase regulatory-like domain-containing protein, partial [Pyrinomonadaceae bacterium]|nr:carboxypeptidase regulatory-like domain-containing protein [Pyrinomonadaceae bacterium]